MQSESTASTGLRDRKKAATRLALSRAAVRLALERGLEQVRIEDIAAAADVSPRTFTNYFGSKEDAFVFAGLERADRLGAALRERPVDEPLCDALAAAFTHLYAAADHTDPERAAHLRLVLSSPALRGAYLKTLAGSERPLAEAIAARTGTEIGSDLYPNVLAAAVSGAARAAIIHWLSAGADTPLTVVLREAIALVTGAVPGMPRIARGHE